MHLFGGFGLGIFLTKRRQTEQRDKAPDNAWRFIILDPLLFWVGGLRGGYPLWEGPAGTFCKSCSTENAYFWRLWIWDFSCQKKTNGTKRQSCRGAWEFIILDPLLFWAGGLQGGYPLWEGPTGISCRSCSKENASFWRLWIWDFSCQKKTTNRTKAQSTR